MMESLKHNIVCIYMTINIIYSLIHVPPTKADKLVLTQTGPVPGRSFPTPQLPAASRRRIEPEPVVHRVGWRSEDRSTEELGAAAARRRGGTGGREVRNVLLCEVCRPERFDFKRPPQHVFSSFLEACREPRPETST